MTVSYTHLDVYKRQIPECGIAEFDQLLGDVEDMKQQIRELIQRSREQEKEAQQMEYEKLVYQINPHFLLNVLNSIQWMAQMSHQKDIGEYTLSLIHIYPHINKLVSCHPPFCRRSGMKSL